MTITVNEIDKILDKALSDYKLGKIKNKNIVFIGADGIGRRSRIEKWIEAHLGEVDPVYLRSAVLMKEKNGIWVKDTKNGTEQYGFADSDMERLLADRSICVCYNLNHQTSEQVRPFEKIFSDRTYCIPVTDKEYDLHILFLIIATAYTEGMGYNVTDIPSIKNCSDVYTVVPDIEEFRQYFCDEAKIIEDEIEDIEEKGKVEDFKKILSSPHFHFVFEKDELFAPYNFMMLFNLCITGSKSEVLSEIKTINAAGKKTFEMFKKIFED